MDISVPLYDAEGFHFVWEDGFSIRCSINENSVWLEANREGLMSLARHLLELSQEAVPEYGHIHLDEYNSLEEASAELIIIKKNRP